MNRRPAAKALQKKLDLLFQESGRWCAGWGIYRLAREVQIEFSDDLGSALGRLDLKTFHIRLNGILLQPENEKLLFETLCHELAHCAAAIRYGTRIAEHGPEWAEYMEKAGFEPRAVIPISKISGLDSFAA